MLVINIIGIIFISLTSFGSIAFEADCKVLLGNNASVDFSNNPLVKRLNSRLLNPDYKVIILGRHGKASQTNKFTAAQREQDPAKVLLDIQRPLAKKGKKAADKLADLVAQLQFSNVGMWGSHAQRVIDTALPSIEKIGSQVRIKDFSQNLYYADVPKEMNDRLTNGEGKDIDHAFFWGHGKTTLALFKKLTGADEGFLPTAAIMIVAVKATDWKEVFNHRSEQVEAYAWSPQNTHTTRGSRFPVYGLESMVESTLMAESALESSPESAYDDDYQGFEFTVLKGN